MGGLSALVYPVYTKRTPSAVVANCPACDIFYEYFERKDRPDLARTLCSAVWNEEGDLETALKTISPFHLLDRMPDIPYHIFHCDEDRSLNIDRHSSALVPEMRKRGLNVTYDIVHGRGHCDLNYAMKLKYAGYIIDAVEKTAGFA